MKINYKKIFDLSNKKILVVGGLGLVGEQVTLALYDLGASVTVLDFDKKNFNQFLKKNKIIKKKKINFKLLDCSKLKKIEKTIKNCFSKNYTPNVLINCAYPRTKDWKNHNFKKIKLNSFEKNISINLNSTIWISKVFANILLNKKAKGRIINFGSIYGILGQDKNLYKGTKMNENLTYSIVKGAIVNATKQFASYYADKNILTNCISPGGLYGPVQGLNKKQEPKFLKNYVNRGPQKRLGYASEVASVVAFLCSDGASYINGANIVVDGGWSVI